MGFFFSGIALSWERDGVKAVASGESWDAPWSSGPGSSPPARAARALEVRAYPRCAPPTKHFQALSGPPPVLSCLPTPGFPVRSCLQAIIRKRGPSGGQIPGVTLKTWASTCLHWSENKDSVVQNIVVIVHVTFTQVWQSSESFDDKASFPEHLRQAIHLLFPILSLDFQNF